MPEPRGAVAVALLSLVLGLGPITAESQPRKSGAGPVRVFLAPLPPPANGFVDAETKRLADSHRDLVKRLALKKKHLAVVTTAETADVTLTLLQSAVQETPNAVTSAVPFTAVAVTRRTLPTLRVQMNAKGYSRELRHQGTWGQAASRVVDEVETWAKDNRDLILAGRTP